MNDDKAREALREKFRQEMGKPFTTWLPAIEKNDVLIFTDEYVDWLEQAALFCKKLNLELNDLVAEKLLEIHELALSRKALEDYAKNLERRLEEIAKLIHKIMEV